MSSLYAISDLQKEIERLKEENMRLRTVVEMATDYVILHVDACTDNKCFHYNDDLFKHVLQER